MKYVLIAVGVTLLMALGGAVHADSYSGWADQSAFLTTSTIYASVINCVTETVSVKDTAALEDVFSPVSERQDAYAGVTYAGASMGGYPSPAPTPEPDTALLLGTGLFLVVGGGFARRRLRTP